MTRGTRSGTRRTAACAGVAALLLGALGCANGSSTEKDFDAWLKDDPVPGATMTDRSATNSIFGRNELFVTWTLTATPSRTAITKAMRGACSFETKAMPRYTLVVDDVTLEIACLPENQTKVAAFWDAVHDLDVTRIEFRQGSVSVRAESAAEAVDADVLETVISAGTDDGLVEDGTFTLDGQDRLSVSVSPEGAMTRELALVHRVVDTAGPATRQVTAIPGEVIASTDAAVAQARAWEDAAQGSDGDRILVVGSAKTGFSRVPANAAARDLVDRIAVRPDVERVTVPTESWDVQTTSLAGSRDVLALVGRADAAATSAFGPLDLGARASATDGACRFRVALPDTAFAEKLLAVCASGAEVEQYTDGDPRVTVTGSGLRAALSAVHDLPRGTRLSISTDTPADFVVVRVDQPLTVEDGGDNPLAEKVLAIWKTLGPVA